MNTTFIPHIQNITDNIIIIVKSKVFYESLKLTLLEVVGGVLIALIISIILASIMVLKKRVRKLEEELK
jgi:ABC-type nitrate/sulfonate/bicarbonate transport system permease component